MLRGRSLPLLKQPLADELRLQLFPESALNPMVGPHTARIRVKLTFLVDNPESWIVPFAREVVECLSRRHHTTLCFRPPDVPCGDMLFLLGCTSMLPPAILARNSHNLVIHESNLPQGRGWSPVAWQVLQGINTIPVVLFEATLECDAGPIYLEDAITLDGTELLPEIRLKQGRKTIELVVRFLDAWPIILQKPQQGQATFFRKRTEKDDELNADKSILENFNHLRIVDNIRYPAWFRYKGRKYIVKIYSATEEEPIRQCKAS